MIAEFYKDCEILITGGSGTVGKATIEKLLRSCDVKRIYVLLRGKRNYSMQERLERLKQAGIFRVLKAKKPHALNKLEAIPGDAMLPQLGISSSNARRLANVSIFFHCAATVLFNEPLWKALCLNVGGTWEALKFAETLKQLKAFMHVSTFFSNPYLTYVEPKLYPPPMDWKLMLQLAQDEHNQELLSALTKKIIEGFPNTYCFSKNLAEHVVNEYRQRLPVIIYRPSIVMSALSEPEPGYPPSLAGAVGVFVLTCAGLLKVLHMNRAVRLDLTPMDTGTIVMLATTVLAAELYSSGQVVDVPPVYLFSSAKLIPYTLKEMQDFCLWERYAYNKCLLLPGFYDTSSRIVYAILSFIYHIVPAMLVDSLLLLFGRKPILMSIARRSTVTLEVMQPFLFNNYQSDGITSLEEILKITNGTEFCIKKDIELSPTEAGLYRICLNLILKSREILMHEDKSTIVRARRVMKIKRFLYDTVRAFLAYCFIRWFYQMLMV